MTWRLSFLGQDHLSHPNIEMSILSISIFAKGGLLLDCGEGTLGQLTRRYGADGADNAVRDLKCIWIFSHIHDDHHVDLARIHAVRLDLLKEEPHEPVLIVGPRQLKRYLDAYQRLEDLDMMFLDCWHTTAASLNPCDGVIESNDDHFSTGDTINSDDNSNKHTNGVDNATGMKSLKKVLCDAGWKDLISIPVVHCPQACGVVLNAAEQTKSVGRVIPGLKLSIQVTLGPARSWWKHAMAPLF